MSLDDFIPNFRSVRSEPKKPLIYLLGTLAVVWIAEITFHFIQLVMHVVYQTDTAHWRNTLFVIGSIATLALLLIILIRKDNFYTNMIVSEEGLIYFDNYRFRPSKIIRWAQICASPQKQNKNDRDISLHYFFTGTSEIRFWYNENHKLRSCKEDFGGYSILPSIYKNKKDLRNAFIIGILTFRKDLRIDPKLLRSLSLSY